MKLAKSFLGLFAATILALLAMVLLFERVPPARIGVKQMLWGSGFVEQDYDMGIHLGISGYHKWHFLDKRTHFLTFSESGGAATGVGQLESPLVIRTKDNNTAQFDLTITYHIIPGQAWRMVKDGLHNIYRERVHSTVMGILLEELAQLSSEDIYSTDMRSDVANNALNKLKLELEAFNVEPDQVLIRQVSFNEAYEVKLQEKQLTSQQRLLATATERVEKQQARTQTREAEIEAAEKKLRGDWDKRLESLRAENEVKVAKILAEAEVYDKTTRATADADYETLVADGNLAIAKAEALRDELRNRALSTRGGHILLAQRAAQNLRLKSVTLNSNDPSIPSVLDIGELVDMLIGGEDSTE